MAEVLVDAGAELGVEGADGDSAGAVLTGVGDGVWPAVGSAGRVTSQAVNATTSATTTARAAIRQVGFLGSSATMGSVTPSRVATSVDTV